MALNELAQGSPRVDSQSSFMIRGTSPLNAWYCGAQNQTAFSTAVASSNFLSSHIIIISRPVTITKISFELVTGAVGASARCGLYSNTSMTVLYPSSLLIDGGDFTCTAGNEGVKTTGSLSVNLAPGVYWAAFNAVGSATYRRHQPGGMTPIPGSPSTIATLYDTLRAARAYGSLPSTYPASHAFVTAPGDSPIVALEFA